MNKINALWYKISNLRFWLLFQLNWNVYNLNIFLASFMSQLWYFCFSLLNVSALIMILKPFFFFLIFFTISVKLKWNKIIGHQNIEGQKEEDLELPFLDLSTIASANNNFAINKKLGEGGFGPVYKVNLWCACTKTMTNDRALFYFVYVSNFSNLSTNANFRVF